MFPARTPLTIVDRSRCAITLDDDDAMRHRRRGIAHDDARSSLAA
jgi:hypothetical protein